MNYIIYRTALNEFVKWSDGNVFITDDTDEVADEINIERNKGTKPVAVCLSFEKIDNGRTMVKLYSGTTMIGGFAYGDEKDFYDGLNGFCSEFSEKNKNIFGE